MWERESDCMCGYKTWTMKWKLGTELRFMKCGYGKMKNKIGQ